MPARGHRRLRFLLPPVLLVALSCACTRDAETPEEVYRSFYAALAAEDWDSAIMYLCAETIDAFRASGTRLAEFLGSGDDPLQVFLRRFRADLIRPLRRVAVVSRQPGAVLIEVTAGRCEDEEDCHVSRVKLRLENQRLVICPELTGLLSGPTDNEKRGGPE